MRILFYPLFIVCFYNVKNSEQSSSNQALSSNDNDLANNNGNAYQFIALSDGVHKPHSKTGRVSRINHRRHTTVAESEEDNSQNEEEDTGFEEERPKKAKKVIKRRTMNPMKRFKNKLRRRSQRTRSIYEDPRVTQHIRKVTKGKPKTPTKGKPKKPTNPPKSLKIKPAVTKNKPKPVSNKPKVTTNKPKSVTTKPKVTTNTPQTTKKSEITTNKLKSVTNKPKVTTNTPQTSTKKSEITTKKSETTPKKSETTTQKSKITTTESKATTGNKPKTTDSYQSTKDTFLKQTNEYRRLHQAKPLKLNKTIEAKAQAYAEKMAKMDVLKHDTDTTYGENIYFSTSSPNDAVKSWYDEVKSYNFALPIFSMSTGHFTAIVWNATTDTGCGVAKSASNKYYVSCKYYPPGNVRGQFGKNVFKKLS
uniref:SCP domain-containing protein n=1 Tax=Strongyloides papillosus TaxID=174720 RepID=A0A0N5BUY7_STREA